MLVLFVSRWEALSIMTLEVEVLLLSSVGSCVEMQTDKGIFEVELATGMAGNTEDLLEKEDIENFVGMNVGKQRNS